MKVSVFGLGYVGAVTAGCLAAAGHEVCGVDPARAKVDAINRGASPIVEKDLDPLIQTAVSEGRLRATDDTAEAVLATELSLLCVGTPSKLNGDLDTRYIGAVSREIGTALREQKAPHTVVVRSTVLPGTIRSIVIPLLEAESGRKAGSDFGVGINPEFMREATAVSDYYHPPKIVIGADSDTVAAQIASIYREIDAPRLHTSIEIAEMAKYTDNSWHALKVAFANEIGAICKSLKIDSHEVMDIFCADGKLNLSPYYLKPGFAFGGSCLPKDIRALQYKARRLDLDLPLINSVLRSNTQQIERTFEMILAEGKRRLSFLGMSFKAGTDDLRESPLVNLIERLIGKGYDIRVYDRNVHLSNLIGANKEYLHRTIPHISSLLVESIEEALAHGEIIIVGNRDSDFLSIGERLRPEHILVDLIRIDGRDRIQGRYNGVNW